MTFLYLLIPILASSGCAFKEPIASTQLSNAVKTASKSPLAERASVGDLWLSFQNGKDVIEKHREIKDGNLKETTSPIPVPAVVPDFIKIRFELKKPQDHFSATDLSAELQLKPEVASSPTKVPVRNLLFDVTDDKIKVGFELEGVRKLLADQDESKAIFYFDVLRGGKSIGTVVFVIRTPPSRLASEEVGFDVAVKDDPEHSEILRALREEGLKSEKLQLDLLSLVRVKNSSASPVSVALPVRLSGKVWQQIDTYTPKPNGCAFDPGAQHSTETLTQSLYAFAVEDRLQEKFYSQLKDARKVNLSLFNIEPQKLKLVGIFGQGQRLATRPKSKSSTINVSVCYPRCDKWLLAPHLVGNDACGRCDRRVWQACEECKRYEASLSSPICGQWNQGFATQTLDTGVQTSTTLEMQSESTMAAASFPIEEEEPLEIRKVALLKTSTQLD